MGCEQHSAKEEQHPNMCNPLRESYSVVALTKVPYTGSLYVYRFWQQGDVGTCCWNKHPPTTVGERVGDDVVLVRPGGVGGTGACMYVIVEYSDEINDSLENFNILFYTAILLLFIL